MWNKSDIMIMIIGTYLVPYLPDLILWVSGITPQFSNKIILPVMSDFDYLFFMLSKYKCNIYVGISTCTFAFSIHFGEVNIFLTTTTKLGWVFVGVRENLGKGTLILLRPPTTGWLPSTAILSLFQRNSGSFPMLYLFPSKAHHFHRCRFLPIICQGTRALLVQTHTSFQLPKSKNW